MIKVEDTKKQRHPNECNSCGKNEKTRDIKISRTGRGWTTVTLCDKCAKELKELEKYNLDETVFDHADMDFEVSAVCYDETEDKVCFKFEMIEKLGG